MAVVVKGTYKNVGAHGSDGSLSGAVGTVAVTPAGGPTTAATLDADGNYSVDIGAFSGRVSVTEALAAESVPLTRIFEVIDRTTLNTSREVYATAPGPYQRTAKAFGVVADGTNMAPALQTWVNALIGRADLGILLPGTYGQSSMLSVDSGTSISAYGAILLAPTALAFPQVQIYGTAGARKSDVSISGLTVNMQGTVLTANSNGFDLNYADDVRLIDVRSTASALQGIGANQSKRFWVIRPRLQGVLGDSIHMQEVTEFFIDSPVIIGVGFEAGIGTTGLGTSGVINNPDISGNGIGIGISGGHDIIVRGGIIHNIQQLYGAGSSSIAIKVEIAYSQDSYDITFDGTKIRSLGQSDGYGVSISQPNRGHVDHPITFKNCDFDTGARPAFSIVSAGDVLIQDQIIRTTGQGVACSALPVATVTNKALTSNVATLTTSSAHGFNAGTIVVAGVDATFNGTYTILSVPTATTLTYALTGTNVASTAATGTITCPGGTTRLKRVTFIGCSQAIYGSTAANSGVLYYEDCTFINCATQFSDATWPIDTRGGPSTSSILPARLSTFSPPPTSTVKSWFMSDAIPVQPEATPLASWPDYGTLNLAAVQASAAQQPFYHRAQLNGKPGVEFTGTRLLSTAAYPTAQSQPVTAFMVVRLTTTGAAQGIIDSLNDAALVYASLTNTWIVNAGTNASSGTANTTAHILCAVFNGASSNLRVDGGAGTVLSPGAAGFTGLVLGNTAAGANPLNGMLFEVALASGAMSLADINLWGAYLGTKYGLTWTTAT